MGYSRKWYNGTGSTVYVAAVTDAATLLKDSGAVYGYAGSVQLLSKTAVYADADNTELDAAAAAWTIDKYLNAVKVNYSGQSGYSGSATIGYTGSLGATGYTGSVGYTGSAA